LDVTSVPLLVAWLRTDRVDICLLPPDIEDSDGIEIEPLVDEDCVIALPHGHRLANSASAPLAALAEEKFVVCYRSFNPGMYDSIFAACARAGFKPQVAQEAPQAVSCIPMVAAGFGIAIVPRAFGEIIFPGVAYVDIEGDAPRSAIALVCRRDERSSAIKNTMRAARLAKLAASVGIPAKSRRM
jgi:DNA-binding transcriptional LysR family regulator